MRILSRAVIDQRYIEPMFGVGPPETCRERLAAVVPAHQLDLFAVAWLAHAVAREGLATYLATYPCLAEVRRGLERLGEVDAAGAIDELDARLMIDAELLDAVERRIPADLYDLVVDHAGVHAAELVPLA